MTPLWPVLVGGVLGGLTAGIIVNAIIDLLIQRADRINDSPLRVSGGITQEPNDESRVDSQC